MARPNAIYFDMDGTIADLYGVPEWLPKLRAEDPSPYLDAKILIDPEDFAALLTLCYEKGIHTGIVSWRSKVESKTYAAQVRAAKRYWLEHTIPAQFDSIHIVKYGTPKHTVPPKDLRGGVLVDDDNNVRARWQRYGGIAIDANDPNWLVNLMALIK